MSDQGPIPDRRADDFGLIETLLWTPDAGFALLPEHLARLAASSAALGFAHDAAKVSAALAGAVPSVPATPPSLPFTGRVAPQGAGWDHETADAALIPPLHGAGGAQSATGGVTPRPPSGGETPTRRPVAADVPIEERYGRHPEPTPPPHLRIRLVLSRDGAIETSATPIDPVPEGTLWRVVLARPRFSTAAPLLRHKTTRRALYEDELARAMKEQGADEVLFLNERDELCESARCNLFVPEGDILLTPPLASGLLPGTLRARLLAEGRAREAVLRVGDLPATFFLGNSVRGLVAARIAG